MKPPVGCKQVTQTVRSCAGPAHGAGQCPHSSVGTCLASALSLAFASSLVSARPGAGASTHTATIPPTLPRARASSKALRTRTRLVRTLDLHSSESVSLGAPPISPPGPGASSQMTRANQAASHHARDASHDDSLHPLARQEDMELAWSSMWPD